MYERKLFLDTTVESKNIDVNNAFGSIAFIGNTDIFGEQWLYSRPVSYTHLDVYKRQVLGLLYANRMQTVAYKVIEKFGLFDLLGTEVKRALRNSYMSDLIINDSYMQCVDELSQVLTPVSYTHLDVYKRQYRYRAHRNAGIKREYKKC